MKLEICAYNVQSCIIAAKAGAARIEFCSNPIEGGTTPSYGMVKYVIEKLSIPIYPIIRPRGGNFFYDEEEFEVMLQDIIICKELGCRGISTGVALKSRELDLDRMKRIVDVASPMGVACHKVFDASPNLKQSLEELIALGFERILTSGGRDTALEGIEIIAELVKQADSRIIIMPGGSVRSTNIQKFIDQTNANEFHSSAITVNNNEFLADELEVNKIVKQLGV